MRQVLFDILLDRTLLGFVEKAPIGGSGAPVRNSAVNRAISIARTRSVR